MNGVSYIQVIVPLKIDWEPFYSVPEGISLLEGDRVSVIFSSKEYIAVVSRTGVVPDGSVSRDSIFPILEKVTNLPPFTALEMRFWRALASYYLCTVGEVYKNVYFLDQPLPKKHADIPSFPKVSPTPGKTLLIQGGAQRTELYLKLAVNAINNGESVLFLVPDIALSANLMEKVQVVFPEVKVYNSALTPAKRRDTVVEARSGKPMVVLGTRSALWIPFKSLGLIIVDDEHDPSHKQESPTPRFHAREASILLGSLCGASVVLGSATPSLESLYNAETGLYTKVELKESFSNAPMIIDIASEHRKKGMSGSFSLKLLAQMHEVLDSGARVLVVCPSKASIEECNQELETLFPSGFEAISITSPSGVKSIKTGEYSMIAILYADSIIGREDFRSDEYAMQLFHRLACQTELLVIQTRESAHPLFSSSYTADMSAQRRAAGYPPFTRLVQVEMKDNDENRCQLRARLLANRLKEVLRPFSDPMIAGPQMGAIRIFFKRDKNLVKGKEALYNEVCKFEQQHGCAGRIVIDVDPV